MEGVSVSRCFLWSLWEERPKREGVRARRQVRVSLTPWEPHSLIPIPRMCTEPSQLSGVSYRAPTHTPSQGRNAEGTQDRLVLGTPSSEEAKAKLTR
jgi:hypothetical protein